MEVVNNEQARAKKMDTVGKIIGWTLRIGIVTSGTVIIIGLMMFFITGQTGYRESGYPIQVKDILLGSLALKPYGVILTGLLLLMLTPVFRVGISIFAFLIEKDYLYTAITLIVFSILMISFLIGKAA